MATGTVKWFNDAKGYGFITRDDGSEDLFANFPTINMPGLKSLKESQKVQFDVTQGANRQTGLEYPLKLSGAAPRSGGRSVTSVTGARGLAQQPSEDASMNSRLIGLNKPFGVICQFSPAGAYG